MTERVLYGVASYVVMSRYNIVLSYIAYTVIFNIKNYFIMGSYDA